MNRILVALISLFPVAVIAQNPYVGTWVAYDIRSFKEKDSIPDSVRDNFKSVIVLKEDLTFSKKSMEVQTNGRYEFTSNKFSYFELDKKNEYEMSWGMRWPRNTTDPSPETRFSFDLNYPELFEINAEFVELDVYYKKIE